MYREGNEQRQVVRLENPVEAATHAIIIPGRTRRLSARQRDGSRAVRRKGTDTEISNGRSGPWRAAFEASHRHRTKQSAARKPEARCRSSLEGNIASGRSTGRHVRPHPTSPRRAERSTTVRPYSSAERFPGRLLWHHAVSLAWALGPPRWWRLPGLRTRCRTRCVHAPTPRVPSTVLA